MHPYTLSKAMGAGLLGTLGQTMLVYGVAPLLLGRSMDLAAMLEHTCPLGLLGHVLSGSVCFPLGYVCLASPRFPGRPVLKGMLWAGLLWGVAECIMAPLLGAGVSSAALGGLPAALWALLGYLVYGATLGGIVGTAGPCAPGAGERQTIPSKGWNMLLLLRQGGNAACARREGYAGNVTSLVGPKRSSCGPP